MNIKEVIRHAVMRILRKGGNRHGESLRVPMPTIEIIADEIAREIAQVIDLFRREGDA